MAVVVVEAAVLTVNNLGSAGCGYGYGSGSGVVGAAVRSSFQHAGRCCRTGVLG